MTANKHSACLLCGSSELRDVSGYTRVALSRCNECSFVFCTLIPTVDELNEYYSHYALQQYVSPITILRYNEWLDRFEKYRKTNKMLDIGCANGLFLMEARKRGWEVYGTEYGELQVAHCRSKGIEMHRGPIAQDTFSDVTFDVIVSIEVIEHINNPRQEMAIIHSKLRQGGIFYCTTPNFNALSRYLLKDKYNIISYPEHLSYYTPRTLKYLMRQHGMKPLRVETTGISITRFNQSSGRRQQSVVSATSDDEILRNKIESRWYLQLAKRILNGILNLTGLGYSLKGEFERG